MNDIAFIFPGQGSQSVGMLAELHQNHLSIKDTFIEASDVLSFDMGQLILEGPAEMLNRTDNTQPALLTCSIALYRYWQQNSDVVPTVMAGHSLGEYSALVCAGVLNFSDALKLVQKRGEFMLQAVPEGIGAMAAILGLEDEIVEQVCEEAAEDQVVSAVNYNSPGQLVIAGHKEAVSRAIDLCKTAGARRALPLPVSGPFHSALMKPAAEKLTAEISKISLSEPKIPVLNNVDVAYETSPDKIFQALIRQLYNPVRWTETIITLQKQGVSHMVECGSGKVLSGLCRRIDRSISVLASCDQNSINKSLEALN
ncbi:MAG: ACP S-malonyltransferase [Gammaproteobacteria bacterium]|nr:ACP S-malonyltransferase [Gammaproteobacteria bacterium]